RQQDIVLQLVDVGVVGGIELHESTSDGGFDLPSSTKPDARIEILVAFDGSVAQEVVMAPDAVRSEEGSDRLDRGTSLAIPGEPTECPCAHDTCSIHEAGIGPEIVLDAVKAVVKAPAPTGAVELCAPDRARLRPHVLIPGPGAPRLRLE